MKSKGININKQKLKNELFQFLEESKGLELLTKPLL